MRILSGVRCVFSCLDDGLRYNDGSRQMYDMDDWFAHMGTDVDGSIGVYTACFGENRRIRIIDAFLKDREDFVP